MTQRLAVSPRRPPGPQTSSLPQQRPERGGLSSVRSRVIPDLYKEDVLAERRLIIIAEARAQKFDRARVLHLQSPGTPWLNAHNRGCHEPNTSRC